jgi:hypothetical protein
LKKYQFLFNGQTLIVACLSFASSWISLRFQFTVFADFLVVGVFIVFPISFTMRAAYRRREHAIQYLSLFKASLLSVFYCFENSKLARNKKSQIKNVLANTSHRLIEYLSGKSEDVSAIRQSSVGFFLFIQENGDELKGRFSVKVMQFYYHVNESLEFLIATKRHQSPWAIRPIILCSIYIFLLIYPASLLNRTGIQVSVGYVFVMTLSKALILICLYNIQGLLEDPFNQNSVDGIKLDDFQFFERMDPIPSQRVG